MKRLDEKGYHERLERIAYQNIEKSKIYSEYYGTGIRRNEY